MYSLMLSGSLVGRSGFSVNSLAMSAVLMLCINPLWFYDVGFQLSFLAMFGILTICPRFQELPLMQWRYVRWIFQSLLVSFAAQLFTVPLVFRYIFVLFGMGDFGSISFNGTIDLWDASYIIIWDYWYRYNSLCVVDCPGGHVAK